MVRQVPSQEISWEKREFPIVVVAENIHSPSNIGMIMRLCEAFGVKSLYFSGPFSNSSTNKFKRSARSADKYLNVIHSEDTISVLQGLKASSYEIVALEITDESKNLASYDLEAGDKIALLIGSERHGINESSLFCTDHSVHINLYGNTGSLNVGTALGIALYDLTNKFLKTV